MWRVKDAGRHAPPRVINGETHISEATCLDVAHSLFATEGVAAVAVVAQSGEWWVWRAEGAPGPLLRRV